MNQQEKKTLLEAWQHRLESGINAISGERDKMDEREQIYRGEMKNITRLFDKDETTKTEYVRNLVFEMIETEVNSEIKYPKVTPRRKQDEGLAHLIEDMIRCELDRLKMEDRNDMMERIVPIQGGGIWHLEWDNGRVTHTTVGEVAIGVVHPKQFVPQPGVYTGVDDMDWIVLQIPYTKTKIRNRWGVDVSDESESNPELRTADGESADNEDGVTLNIGYKKNETGVISQAIWCNDVLISYFKDYQARHLKRCKKCGALQLPGVEPIGKETRDGSYPLDERYPAEKQGLSKQKPGTCRYCGSAEFEDSTEDFEERYDPIIRSDGTVLYEGAGVASEMEDGTRTVGLGEPAHIPYYKPDVFPVVLQKNVSAFGRVFGISDVDIMRDQQNATNRMTAKIFEKLLTNGSYITLPPDAQIRVSSKEGKSIRISKPTDKNLIGTYDMEQDISKDLSMLSVLYEDARNEIGITDSYQGRKDATATSGKAKEISATQASGRMESKRVMKCEAWERIFELIFKFRLAYCDEPRPVRSKNLVNGETEYRDFNRYDFLEQDENGAWWWNDLFDFSCDASSPLEKDRQALWQETRMNLNQGAYGDVTQMATLLIFWRHMEALHYPKAAETIRYIEEQQQKQQEQAMAVQQAMEMQQAMAMQGGNPAGAMPTQENQGTDRIV